MSYTTGCMQTMMYTNTHARSGDVQYVSSQISLYLFRPSVINKRLKTGSRPTGVTL